MIIYSDSLPDYHVNLCLHADVIDEPSAELVSNDLLQDCGVKESEICRQYMFNV